MGRGESDEILFGDGVSPARGDEAATVKKRRARVATGGNCDLLEEAGRVAAHLPANYSVTQVDDQLIIEGEDVAGWTLDEYVIPRLQSGLIFAEEID